MFTYADQITKYATVLVGLKNDSMFKSTGCFSRGPRFNSQYPYCDPQTSITPDIGDLVPSFGLLSYQAHMWYIGIQIAKHHTHEKVVLT